MRVVGCLAVLAALAGPAAAGPVNVIDGDTVERDGTVFRLAGIDAPEIHGARCAAERTRGLLTAARLIVLLKARGGRVVELVAREKYGRRLGRLIIGWPSAGEEPWADIAIREGLARPWDGRGKRPGWC